VPDLNEPSPASLTQPTGPALANGASNVGSVGAWAECPPWRDAKGDAAAVVYLNRRLPTPWTDDKPTPTLELEAKSKERAVGAQVPRVKMKASA
jgi:hypothetical protein